MLLVQSLGRFALTMVLGLAVAAWAARAEARGGGHGGGHHGGGHHGGHAGGHHGGHAGNHTHHGEHHHTGHHDHHHDGHHVHHHHYFHGGGAWGGGGWGGWGWAGVAAPLGYAAGRAYAVPGYGGYYGGTDTVPSVNVNNASLDTSDNANSDDAQGNDDDDDGDDDDSDDADSGTPNDDVDGRGAPPVDYEAPLPKDRGAIHIKLPDPSATITFDGEPILGRGPDRLILTPSIQAGKPFKYQVQATWTQNGQTVTELREGTVVAGKYALANFDAPANAAPAARTSQATSATQPGTK